MVEFFPWRFDFCKITFLNYAGVGWVSNKKPPSGAVSICFSFRRGEAAARPLIHVHGSIVELLSTNGCVKHKPGGVGDKYRDPFFI